MLYAVCTRCVVPPLCIHCMAEASLLRANVSERLMHFRIYKALSVCGERKTWRALTPLASLGMPQHLQPPFATVRSAPVHRCVDVQTCRKPAHARQSPAYAASSQTPRTLPFSIIKIKIKKLRARGGKKTGCNCCIKREVVQGNRGCPVPMWHCLRQYGHAEVLWLSYIVAIQAETVVRHGVQRYACLF